MNMTVEQPVNLDINSQIALETFLPWSFNDPGEHTLTNDNDFITIHEITIFNTVDDVNIRKTSILYALTSIASNRGVEITEFLQSAHITKTNPEQFNNDRNKWLVKVTLSFETFDVEFELVRGFVDKQIRSREFRIINK